MSTVIEATTPTPISVPRLPKAESCVLIIFGASGDLTRRKLMPALYDLAKMGCMDSRIDVLGVGRTPFKADEFRRKMRDAVAGSTSDFDEARWRKFEKKLDYLIGDVNDPAFYPQLSKKLEEMRKAGGSGNHLFYVSTPASVAGPIVEGLGTAGLNRSESGWTRIVLEKPFGHDLETARELNRVVQGVFEEENVYRIDHYLGKETVQNILVFRFGNSLFEPVWNRNYIDEVVITAAETDGIGSRGAFYEETGALRDMVANHMLQLLALTAMEPPVTFDADSVRQQKVQVLRSIEPMSVREVALYTVRGQYGPGEIDGKSVRGYREEDGVSPDSLTDTYAAVKFYVQNWRWAGVPFIVRTGKRLARHGTDIQIRFKRTPQALFARTPSDQLEPNVISLGIQPDEGITISFGAKRPGSEMRTVPVQARFSYQSAFGEPTPPAYKTLLLDAMRGDATLFTRRDEVEAEWRIITPIEQAWLELPTPSFPNYAAGSEGPEETYDLLFGGVRRIFPKRAA